MPSTHISLTTQSRACNIALPPTSSPLTTPPDSLTTMSPPVLPIPVPTHHLMGPSTLAPDSSDSNSDTSPAMDNTPYAPAVVSGGKGNHAPILSAGHIMIAAMHIFENSCWPFFQNKKIPEDECIVNIIYNFESLSIQSWVNTHHDHLLLLTFPTFILEFKKKFLPRNGQDNLVAIQISTQGTQDFLSWTEVVWEVNSELGIASSDYYIEKMKIQAHLVPCLSCTFKTLYNANNTHGTLDGITDLESWIQHIHLLDVENQSKCNEWLKIVQAAGCMTSKTTCTLSTHPSSSMTPSAMSSTWQHD